MSPQRARLFRRVAARVARICVLLAVVLSVFAASTAAAAVAVGQLVSAPTCHCPHDDGDDDKRACPCCHPDEGGDHCLPVAGGCGGAFVLAPPVAGDTLIPLPLLAGIATTPSVAELRDRLMHQGLERPPRA